ncbi:PqqD family peptide modification chaperone [Methanobacterium spitsbergense]|uniref:PqqD family peptide modification chaperone n=1 Tax=Methanobacterium spitsbergense TaxID=2874285 RepID=A0A8T5UYS2_9EURY|nr:PqqD family peptide modification chaperone [Methanobacterium spitsbergense]MBZ2166320.1 PqqD family peptide modification chaperone [Methanobacterium spitsbergense]
MTKISIDSTLVVADDVVSCDLDGEAAILNMNDGVYYGLDPIGAKIWNLIQKPRVVNDIVEIIWDEYDVDKNQCKCDIFELIKELLDNGLVKINE